ncbi:hypothetical protein M378DRAFT_338376 [Amanita muscaria Koide BX008]|uniref:RING-type E3 ubiquitin transferase n=1 Tax=Amanita muscaria (strain Koide BX008) TaxID=946122 RepID=A0A0C2WPJ2_AMAMK|nr:hypothetical protein M378DRAFT_338376 [Amanita muscaria Koide BX008]
MTQSTSPPSKRVKLESVSPVTTPQLNAEEEIEEGGSGCSICLQGISDQTILPTCSHEFCFECLLIWTKQSRRCPLCSREIGEYLIHNVRSKHDFSKHYLTPLRSSPVPQNPLISVANLNLRRVSSRRRPTVRERERERRQRQELNEVDKLQQSIGKRRWVYRNGLYAKHVASNAFTRYKPYPSPAQFSMSPDLISRTTSFVRRELQIWPNLDIEFLTTFTISIMKSIDIRSESAIKLLAEFLDMDSSYVEGGRHVNAEHFAHEIYSFVRSPYRDIFVYDDVVQILHHPRGLILGGDGGEALLLGHDLVPAPLLVLTVDLEAGPHLNLLYFKSFLLFTVNRTNHYAVHHRRVVLMIIVMAIPNVLNRLYQHAKWDHQDIQPSRRCG